MRRSNSNINADRTAIRQALAILEEEVAIIEDNSIEIPFNINIDEGLKIRYDQALPSRKAIRRVSWSPEGSYSSCDGSSSYNSLKSETSREASDKTKRRSHTKRSKRPYAHKSKKEDNSNSSSMKQVVRFTNNDHVFHIPHINDIPQEEIDQCWMNKEDYHFIRSRSHKLINMMEDQYRYPISADTMIVNKHLVCIRGLEGNTSQKQTERDQLKNNIQAAVFQLQQKQKEDGVVNPQAIRQVSKKYSKESTKNARLVGISDKVISLSRRNSF